MICPKMLCRKLHKTTSRELVILEGRGREGMGDH